jgi:hypothetical protein
MPTPMKNTQATDQQPESGNRITLHTLFPTGKSLIHFPESTKFLHISHNEHGELILHALEPTQAQPHRPAYRRFFATRSVDRYLLSPDLIFVGASTDHTKTTILVFTNDKRYDSDGREISTNIDFTYPRKRIRDHNYPM